MKITPVILAGGTGERLWPLSSPEYPKQFVLRDARGLSLFQAAVARVENREQFNTPLIIANEVHRFLVRDQLHALGCTDAIIILEPIGRNTAPAIAIASLYVKAQDMLLIMPADHQIDAPEVFHEALPSALRAAGRGSIVTFAISPTSPATGYGYIQYGAPLENNQAACAISRFIEKPEKEVAQSLLRAGGYGWNSGIFMASAATLLAEYQRHASELLEDCREAYMRREHDGCFLRLEAERFHAFHPIAFDRAIMERTDKGAVIPLAMGWHDLGSWQALDDVATKDGYGNAVTGNPELLDVTDSFIYSDGAQVAAIGLKDMLVVAAHGQIFIAPKYRAQEVKSVVTLMESHPQASISNRMQVVHRPWGTFQAIDRGDAYQVKKLMILPQAKISLQTHGCRAEHWVVVKGTATVTRGVQRYELRHNESIYIAVGERHRLENLTNEELIVIEVQTGDYLGEDDIERLEDVYARTENV